VAEPGSLTTDGRLDALERWREETDRKWLEAFPGGDAAGHRRFHEAIIENTAAKKRLAQAVMEKTIAGLVWAAMFGIGLACWKYFLGLIGRGG
jgi:hypothetical protein